MAKITAAIRKEYLRSFHREAAAAEGRWIGPIKKALDVQFNQIYSYAEQHGIQAAALSVDGVITTDPMDAVMRQMYIREGRRSGRREYAWLNMMYGKEYDSMTKSVTKGFPVFDEWVRIMTQYYDLRGADQVVMITETTRKYMQDRLIEGLALDLTLPEIRDSLIIPDVVNRRRANVIGRTETISALNFSADTAARSAPIEFIKEWLSTHDNRTRYRPRDKGDHVVLDGERHEMDEKFSNGGRWPGDPDLVNYERIQCRCTKIHDAKRDESGRLVLTTGMRAPNALF